MEGAVPILFIALIICLVITAAIFGWLQEKRRREAFQQLAARLGMFYTQRDTGLAQGLSFLDKLRQGSNRYAMNILQGPYEGFSAMVFDFHYETYSTDSKGRRQTHHHYMSFFVLKEGIAYPELVIYPETFFSKIGQMLGYDDIDFESIEFSKAFVVRSKDKRFAYDICHTRMMEYLLRHRELCIEIDGPCVSISFDKRLEPEEIEPKLRQLMEIRRLFPEYLYRS